MFKTMLLAIIGLGSTTAIAPAAVYKPIQVQEVRQSKVIELTHETFQKELTLTDRPVLLMFHAPWCSWCKTMYPVIEEIANEYPNVKVASLDTEKYPVPNIDVIPAFVVVVKGKPVWAYKGACTKGNLIGALKPYLKK